MALPRLATSIRDAREARRIFRAVLEDEVVEVALASPPAASGPHLLDLDVSRVADRDTMVLLASPQAGGSRRDRHAMRIRPTTRGQSAEIAQLLDGLGAPSSASLEVVAELEVLVSEPPAELEVVGSEPPAELEEVHSEPPEEATLLQPARAFGVIDDPIAQARRPIGMPTGIPAFGVIDSIVPQSSTSFPPEPPPPPDPAPIVTPNRVVAGKYRIESPLGSGNAATVYRATHLGLKRAIALKILHDRNRSDEQFVKRFQGEALAASKLEHVNVTRVIDFGEDHGELYLAMELIEGMSLERIISEEGAQPALRVAKIGLQVCRALTFAHEHGVIHRDIKPENVMILRDVDDDDEPIDVVKVCDFGLAKLRTPDAENNDLTVAGMLCGSPAYMSPEQSVGEHLDARSDIYSLGVTLFEAVTGDLPHEANALAELFSKKLTSPPRKPSSIRPVDAELERVILRTLSVDREARPASAKELRKELKAVVDRLAK